MAIIKCPECGHQISDKAPTCPSCGVEIAGKIIKCPQCGEVYFKDQPMCPNCHHATAIESVRLHRNPAANQTPATSTSAKPAQQSANTQSGRQTPPPTSPAGKQQPQKNRHTGILIFSLLIALIICGTCFYLYNQANDNREMEAYESAMDSTDPLVLQNYLNTFGDNAPEAHVDSIQAHLKMLQQADADWTNTCVSGTKTALEDYLSRHPDSPHRQEALHKIDSLDWSLASNENTPDAYQTYLDAHSTGEHVEEARAAVKELNAKTVMPEEKEAITTVMRRFFQSINTRNADGLQSTVSTFMTNFLGKHDATRDDVVTFMNKIYKDDITNMNFHINNDYKISKKEVGDEEYEYNVEFSATQDIDRTDDTLEKHARYRINATVGPDGLISAMTMVKIMQ